MPRFAFEAITGTGTLVRGTLEAATQASALEQLLASGQTPVVLREAIESGGLFSRAATLLRWRSFDYVLLLRQLGLLLHAGLPVERALSILTNLAPGSSSALRVRQILDRVRGGESLSQGFAFAVGEAPAYIARLIAAGEASGKLPDVVARLAANLMRGRDLESRFISSLTYPAVLVVAMSGVLWVVFTSVLPRLTPIFAQAGASMPLPTQMLLGVGWFFQTFGLFLLILLIAAAIAFARAWREPRFRLALDRHVLETRFLLGLPARYEAAQFCRNLQTLLEGGLPLERALRASREGAVNRWFQLRMKDVETAVADGIPLRTALAQSHVVPSLVVEFAAVGEETGHLGAMIGEAGTVLDHEVETQLDRITSLVLPAATLIMGALVGLIMAGIVSGILAVNNLAH
jgi:general secretion pathway protein F